MQSVSFMNPYSDEEKEIERRQQMALMLQQQGQQTLPTESIGGLAIRRSPFEYLNKTAQQLSGAYQGKQASEMAKALRERQQGDMTSDMSALSAALGGTPAQAPIPSPADELGGGPAMPAQPAVPGQVTPELMGQLKSPQMQQIAMQQYLAELQRQNAPPEMKDLGDRIGLIKNGQLVGFLPKGATPDTRLKEEGDDRRHLIPSGGAVLGSQTTMRGQDLVDARTRAEGAANRGVTMRGQNLTDQRAADALAAGRWTNDLDRGLQINTATGETRPIVSGGAPIGQKEKPLTESQGRGQMFGTRAAEADKILAGLEDKISTTGLATKRGAENIPIIGGVVGAAGNMMLSADQQKVEQAQRNFINAVLRQESGAVISPQEFENAQKQYFPQPADSPQVREQKRANRQSAIEGFRVMSGPAGGRIDSARRPYEGPERRAGGETVNWNDLK